MSLRRLHRRQVRSTRRRPALYLLALEIRQVPAVFNVANGDMAAFVTAVNMANNNNQDDTINLAPNGSYAFNTVADTTDGNNALPLLQNDGAHALTINGNKATVTRASGAPTMRFFNVDTADLLVDNLTLTRGVSDTGTTLNSEDGGAFLLAGGRLTLTDCILSNNQGLRAGGGIVADIDGAVLTLTRCVFSNNSATDSFSIGGGVVVGDNMTATITDCTFDGNKCTDNGGAIFTFSGGVTLNISGTTFSNNQSTGANFTGGAIYNLSDITMTNCTLSGNRAASGAAIDNSAGTGTLQISNCTMTGNSAFLDQAYGALLVGGTSVSVHDSIVAGNTFDATVTGGGSPDVATPFGTVLQSNGYNIIGDGTNAIITAGAGDQIGTLGAAIDPILGPLQSNGGPTFTRLPLFGSPAIDSGDPSFAAPPNFDQRGAGFPRVLSGRLDIGAVEASLFNLAVTVDDGVTTALPGQGVIYTIIARNLGPAAVSGIVIKDLISNQFSNATWIADLSNGASGNTSGAGSINESIDLSVGGIAVYTLSATIAPAAAGTLVNTAQILPPSGGTDITPADNTSTDSDILTPIADLSVAVSSTTTLTAAGKTIHYSITVRNDGPGTAGGAAFSDHFSAAIAAARWTSSATEGATGNTLVGSGNIDESLTLPPNATVTYQIDATVAVSAPGGPFTNTATISPPPFGTDPELDNNSASLTANVIIGAQVVVTAGDVGQLPLVKIFNSLTGIQQTSFAAYASGFRGGVRVAVADFNGDGTQDVVTAAGPGGGPHIRVFDGKTGSILKEFFAYDAGFTGGVYVAAGDVNGDGVPDIITGAGAGGGPHVRVFNGLTGKLLPGPIGEFFAFDASFHGGVRVAAGDTNKDGKAEVITAAGPGGGPHVIVWNGADRTQRFGFFAYSASFHGGVYVTAGDANFDGNADIITGAGDGGGPLVRYFDGRNGAMFREFYAYPQNTGGLGSNSQWSSGVRVSFISDIDNDGLGDLVVAPGTGRGPDVRVYSGAALTIIRDANAFDPSFLGGVFVGGA
jgi:uncharacterized repeat protein (TIGR01451 family)